MSRERRPASYDPPAESRGYISPRAGYVPAHQVGQPTQPSGQGDYVQNDKHHPLHRVYRKRMRGVRVRWFTSGLTLGILLGIFLTLLVSAVVVTSVPSITQNFTGDPDVAVVIGENYINRAAANQIKSGYATGVSGLTLTALQIDVAPGNLMEMQPVFRLDTILGAFNVNAKVSNQLAVKDGQLAVNMVGDPQLGNLNVPLDILPFDLKGQVSNAINKVNNSVIIAEINQSLQAGYGGSAFVVDGVTTNDSGITVRLKSR